MLSVSIRDLNALLDAHEFTRRHGLRVVAVGDGECELEVPYRPENDRPILRGASPLEAAAPGDPGHRHPPGGVVSGHVYMHAADVAFWLAIKTRLGLDDASVTSSMTTAFLGSARREPLQCRARVLKLGRRLVYGTADCFARERPMTHHTLTYARM